MATITSDVNEGLNDFAVLVEVQQTLAPFVVAEMPPGYTINYTGQNQDQQARYGSKEKPEHCGDHVETKAGICLHGYGHGFTFANGVGDLAVEILELAIARGFPGNVERFENGHTTGHECSQRATSSCQDVLFDQAAYDGNPQNKDIPAHSPVSKLAN